MKGLSPQVLLAYHHCQLCALARNIELLRTTHSDHVMRWYCEIILAVTKKKPLTKEYI